MSLRDFIFCYLKLAAVVCTLVQNLQHAIAQSEQKAKEYCQSDFFNVSCGTRHSPADEVILMESAQYGRMHSGTCVSGNIGCSVSVLEFVDQRCSGRRHCSVYVSDPALHKLAPCSKEYTSYLEAKYTCLSVAKVPSPSGCTSRDRHITLSDKRVGYIASATLTEHGYGSGNCLWKIEADPRQRIRLSLLSFGTQGMSVDSSGGDRGEGRLDPGTDACYEIGELREPGGTGTTPSLDQPVVFSICSESMRENVFFVSVGSVVVVQLKPSEVLKALTPFIIKYEVLGCRSLKPPPGGYVRIEGNTATVRCNDSKETWFLTCTGNSWLGHVGNCTDRASITASHGDVASLVEENFPYGILLVVAIGVALGVLIGGILLSCVAYYMKRQTRLHGYSEPADWTKQMLDEMEAYNEAKQVTTASSRYIHESTAQTPLPATTTTTMAAVGLMGSPSRTVDRTVLGAPHIPGCTCPKSDENYSTRTALHSTGGGDTACGGPDSNRSRFLYEIPQFNN